MWPKAKAHAFSAKNDNTVDHTAPISFPRSLSLRYCIYFFFRGNRGIGEFAFSVKK